MFSPKPLTEPWLENCSLMAASSVLSVTTKTGASLRRVSSLGRALVQAVLLADLCGLNHWGAARARWLAGQEVARLRAGVADV